MIFSWKFGLENNGLKWLDESLCGNTRIGGFLRMIDQGIAWTLFIYEAWNNYQVINALSSFRAVHTSFISQIMRCDTRYELTALLHLLTQEAFLNGESPLVAENPHHDTRKDLELIQLQTWKKNTQLDLPQKRWSKDGKRWNLEEQVVAMSKYAWHASNTHIVNLC
jgi:hypothetical protein